MKNENTGTGPVKVTPADIASIEAGRSVIVKKYLANRNAEAKLRLERIRKLLDAGIRLSHADRLAAIWDAAFRDLDAKIIEPAGFVGEECKPISREQLESALRKSCKQTGAVYIPLPEPVAVESKYPLTESTYGGPEKDTPYAPVIRAACKAVNECFGGVDVHDALDDLERQLVLNAAETEMGFGAVAREREERIEQLELDVATAWGQR